MTTHRRLTKGLILPRGSFRPARWASTDDNVRRLKAYIKRLQTAQLRDPEQMKLKHLPWLRMKRRWRDRAGIGSKARVRWPR